mgnify:FL=1
MSQIGIIGLPNVGKSTVFTALTKQDSQIGDFPFSTTEIHTAFGEVVDSRLTEAAKIENSQKIVYPKIQLYDLPLSPNKPVFTGNVFAKLREMDGFAVVLRDFESSSVDWGDVPQSINEQLEKIKLELIIADLEILNNKEGRLIKESKALSEKPKELLIVNKSIDILESGGELKDYNWDTQEFSFFRDLALLTLKPKVYLINTEEEGINNKEKISEEGEVIVTSAKIEQELSELDSSEENDMRKQYSVEESLLSSLLNSIYKELNLISFFTVGDKESRAWTIPVNTKIPEASGKIHSDMEKGFNKAEVVGIDDFIEGNGWEGLKNSIKIRLEGKEYIVRDGDVVIIRFSK